MEAGAGLPGVARAAARALEASVIVLDSRSSVLAVACASPEDERAVMALEGDARTLELTVAELPVGQLRYRPRGASRRRRRCCGSSRNLIGLEVDRAKAPERASEAAVADFVDDLLGRRITDGETIAARAAELGCDLSRRRQRDRRPGAPAASGGGRLAGAGAHGRRARRPRRWSAPRSPRSPRAGWTRHGQGPNEAPAAGRARARDRRSGPRRRRGRRAAAARHARARVRPARLHADRGRSRHAADPADLHRAGTEALLAANVAEARGLEQLSFEETGAYRLLLPAMSEDPSELQGFFDETVAPLVAYDEQYETELVRTLESFLDADGNVARTAERLFTHRHTIRYRLERVRELTGLDVSSTDGRERLSLGLKAMRVLGIQPPGGPAQEKGAEAGRVPRRAQGPLAPQLREPAALVPGLDLEMVGGLAQPYHDELRHV